MLLPWVLPGHQGPYQRRVGVGSALRGAAVPLMGAQGLWGRREQNGAGTQMDLSVTEQAILDGEEGAGAATAMELVVGLGTIFGSQRLIPISSAQVSGVSYKTIGEAGAHWLEEFGADARVRVPTYLNPSGMDSAQWQSMGISQEFHDGQERILKAYARIGVELSQTCTPYQTHRRPHAGEHLAYAESSAVVFVNSVIGARTNREGGPAALAAAIVGRTAEYGFHLPAARAPQVLIEVDSPTVNFALLGNVVGGLVGGKVPYVRLLHPLDDDLPGLRWYRGGRPTEDELKWFGAAAAASGSVAMFHLEGRTPDWQQQSVEGLERITITPQMLASTSTKLTNADKVDLVAIGCPHCSVEELNTIAALLKDHDGPRSGAELWVCTNHENRAAAPEAVEQIERWGKVIVDTCMVVCPIEELHHSTAVPSAKAAKYLRLESFGGQKVFFGNFAEVLHLL